MDFSVFAVRRDTVTLFFFFFFRVFVFRNMIGSLKVSGVWDVQLDA